MKSFIVALIIIFILLGLTTANALIISSRLSSLEGDIAALKFEKSDGDNIKYLLSRWNEIRKFLCITVKESVLKEGDALFCALKFSARYKDEEQFEYCLSSLKAFLKDLKKADIPYPFESILT
ncbi:MAG: hypothetical protein PUB34_05715 [Clostridia bacterium]|nr:hypothetical protein [Clostridia bacterium]